MRALLSGAHIPLANKNTLFIFSFYQSMKKTFVLFGVISALMLSSCGTKDTSVPV